MITNARLLELRRQREACQEMADKHSALMLEEDYLDLYKALEQYAEDPNAFPIDLLL